MANESINTTPISDVSTLLSYENIKYGISEKKAILIICGLLHLKNKGLMDVSVKVDQQDYNYQQLLSLARQLAADNKGQLQLLDSVEKSL